MSKHHTIPRFLLPQLTWKSAVSKSSPFSSHTKPLPLKQPFLYQTPHRTITSIAQPWDSKRTTHSPWIAHIHRSRAHPNADRSSASLGFVFRFLSQHPFSTTSFLFRDHHFDTLKFVQRLKDEGFSEEQSKAMMLVLSDVIEESIQNLTRTMVLREGMLPL